MVIGVVRMQARVNQYRITQLCEKPRVFQIENFDENILFNQIINKLENKELNHDKIKVLKNSIDNNIKIINNLLDGCNHE